MRLRPRLPNFVPIDAEVPIDRAVMARAFALLFGAGATLVLVTMALSSSDSASIGIVGPPLAAARPRPLQPRFRDTVSSSGGHLARTATT